MDQVISTVFFNGQFWISIIEKVDSKGQLSVAQYTFGPEPSAAELFDFYLNRYDCLRFHSTQSFRRRKNITSEKEAGRRICKSHQLFKEQQKKYFSERNADRKKDKKLLEQEKFLLKQLKRKEKKRGR